MTDIDKDTVACVLGPGGLVPLAWSGQVSVDPGVTDVLTSTASGARRLSRRRARSRSWHVTGEVPVDWARNLMAVAEGVLGAGPFFWCPPMAQQSNMLPGGFSWPSVGIPTVTSEGIPLRVSGSSSYPTPMTPVRPGQPLTAALWVQGTGSFNIVFYDVAGGGLSTVTTTASTTTLQRVSRTVTAPATAVYALISARDFGLMGGPSLSWTDHLTPYTPPGGCASTILQIGEWSHGHLGRDMASALVNVDFTVVEVG